MTLNEARKREFGGAIKPASLRAEHRRGNLVIERIGRKEFVTRTAIMDMRRKCQLDPSARDPRLYLQSARTAMEALRQPGGSSGMATASAAQDALSATLKALKKH